MVMELVSHKYRGVKGRVKTAGGRGCIRMDEGGDEGVDEGVDKGVRFADSDRKYGSIGAYPA